MSVEHNCPDCHVPMAEGYIADRDYGHRHLPEWYSGKPEFGLFGGLVVDRLFGEKKVGMPIETYRCPECGYLRYYAVRTIGS